MAHVCICFIYIITYVGNHEQQAEGVPSIAHNDLPIEPIAGSTMSSQGNHHACIANNFLFVRSYTACVFNLVD